MFVVIVTYQVKLELIDKFRAAHLEFLQRCFDDGILVASGPQNPRMGGVIIARGDSKRELAELLAEDPFAINNLATYEIIEFTPTAWDDSDLRTIM